MDVNILLMEKLKTSSGIGEQQRRAYQFIYNTWALLHYAKNIWFSFHNYTALRSLQCNWIIDWNYSDVHILSIEHSPIYCTHRSGSYFQTDELWWKSKTEITFVNYLRRRQEVKLLNRFQELSNVVINKGCLLVIRWVLWPYC